MNLLNKIYMWVENESNRSGNGKVIVFFKMVVAYIKYGVDPKEYYIFKFSEKSNEQKRTFFTSIMFNKLLKRNNNPAYIQILDDKYIFSKTFSEFIGRRVVRCDKHLKTTDLESLFEIADKVVYKPKEGRGGIGVSVFEKSDYPDLDVLAEELRSMPEAVLESWISQHEDVSRLYPHAVNCVRIATLYRDGKVTYLGATLTLGINNSKIANALQNSLFCLIDTETGEVFTNLCNYADELFEKHPDTGFVPKGYKIPYWEEIIELVTKAANVLPQVGYVGWDVAISENGPIIIEGNRGAGYTGYQHYLLREDGMGTRAEWEPFIY